MKRSASRLTPKVGAGIPTGSSAGCRAFVTTWNQTVFQIRPTS